MFVIRKMFCWPKYDLTEAIALVINHQEEAFIKRMIVRVLQNYANTTTNDIDDAMVDTIEKCLFPKDMRERDILIHF